MQKLNLKYLFTIVELAFDIKIEGKFESGIGSIDKYINFFVSKVFPNRKINKSFIIK